MPKPLLFAILILIVFILDFYTYKTLKTAFRTFKFRRIILIAFIAITILLPLLLISFTYVGLRLGWRSLFLVSFFMKYIGELIVFLVAIWEDVWIGIRSAFSKISKTKPTDTLNPLIENAITRKKFISQIALVAGTIPIATMSFGILSGVYDYKIKRVKLLLPNMPSGFNGMKIIQISDIHSGSFYNKTAVMGGVEMLMAEKPDVVFFTGDIVNNVATEMNDYVSIFSKVKAPLGVYSILGNHDYGDYVTWDNPKAKAANLTNVLEVHKALGWDLLMNEHRALKVGTDSLAIVGIENWGASLRFPKHGRMDLAMAGTEDYATKLLLSHDPSHWRAEVLEKYPEVDAMFSGHTHGMQFGIDIAGIKWSPVQYVYPEWSGLYTQAQQQLYVNVGYGFLGYPGRVGILPEITVFELTNA